MKKEIKKVTLNELIFTEALKEKTFKVFEVTNEEETDVLYINSKFKNTEEGFCECETIKGTYSDVDSDQFGYWDMCTVCNKKIEDGFHYYNHYDGEDHDDIEMY